MDVAKICEQVRGIAVRHPKYEQSLNLSYSHLAMAQEGSVVVLAGPTRVGKTTVTNALKPMLARSRQGGSSVPLVRVDATTTDQGFMSTKYLKIRLLQELGHPLFHSSARYQPRLSMSESSAQLMLNKAIEALGTRFIIIDEAHHLLETKNSRLVGSALDNIKCLGNECGVVVLLSGGYRLLGTCFDSAHLNGRLALVNFSRYRPIAAEVHHFDMILMTLDEFLPWGSGDSLVRHRDLIYEGSLGCYGLIQGWAMRALATMAGLGHRRLSITHFIESRYKEQLDPIRDEIKLGEALLSKLKEPDPPPSPGGPPQMRGKRGARHPGVRKLGRDKVGGRQ